MRDEAATDGLVPIGLFGVGADHEPLGRPRSLVAFALSVGATTTSLTRRFPRTVRYRPGRPERRGGLTIGVAELFGLHVVPTAVSRWDAGSTPCGFDGGAGGGLVEMVLFAA